MGRFFAPLGGLATIAILFLAGFSGSRVEPVARPAVAEAPSLAVGSAAGAWFFAPPGAAPVGDALTQPPDSTDCRPVSPLVADCPEPAGVSAGRLAGAAGWGPLVAQYFAPEDVDRALAIIRCESGGNPTAANPTSTARGLFQHLGSAWDDRAAKAGWSGADIFDPEANTAVAAWLVYEGGGWSHWNASGHCW